MADTTFLILAALAGSNLVLVVDRVLLGQRHRRARHEIDALRAQVRRLKP